MRCSTRLSGLPVYPFARWAARVEAARQRGLDLIRLDIGNPDLPPPQAVVDALCGSARQPQHHGYTGYRGLPSLRQAIARYYQRRFGLCLDPEHEVVPLIGSKEGIVNLALACLDRGDVALVPDPGYAPYTMGAALAGAEVSSFPLRAERDFLPDLDAIPTDVADRATLMWLNYPNNPTGAVAGLDFFARAVDYAMHRTVTSPTMATGRPASCRLQERRRLRWSSTPCPRPSTWPVGVWAWPSATLQHWPPWPR